jgi:ribosome biogenesis GTPase
MQSDGGAPNPELAALGWDARRAAAFAPYRAAGLEPGRVALEHTHLYRVITAGGEALARVSGRFRHEAESRSDFPAVGDWVALEPPRHADARGRGRTRCTIQAVLPRSSRFVRKTAGSRTEEQVVAANVDVVFLVAGLDGDFNLRRLERCLVLAWESGSEPILLLNKADLAGDLGARIADVQRIAPAVPVVATSARTGTGFEALAAHLQPGRTVALLGSSGVGKSSIVNRLAGRDLLQTRDVRASDSRGRHTTSARQLVVLPSGALVIDTPGMRELQLWDVDEGVGRAVGDVFDDIEALAPACRFRDCRHRAEPGCAVRRAVADGRLPRERLDSYLKLQNELRQLKARTDERARQEAKRTTKMMTRALKKFQKEEER